MNTNRIVIGTLVALFLSACAHGPDVKMLEKRANYEAEGSEGVELGVAVDGTLHAPKRTESQTADIYIHRHEMATGDYFMGGWVRTVVFEPRWSSIKAGPDKPAAGLLDVSSAEDVQKEKDEKAEELRRRMEGRGQK